VRDVRAVIARADPQLPITSVRMMTEVVEQQTAPRVTQLRVVGAFTIAAFLLAAIGIHGLLAFTVAARSREIGVRIALLMTLAGSLLPAWRAVRVDPLAATRTE
jgi:ABC-type antimicrobial peptide transport system permease subunit